jgi:tetratricopeptide (TPR) repeat protein
MAQAAADLTKDFLISYSEADRTWAEWIAMTLETAGYTTSIQAWDVRPGMNLVHEMDQAVQHTRRTIMVLSPNYIATERIQPEWYAAFLRDPTGAQALLVPVQVRASAPASGLLANLTPIDLVGKDEGTARILLLDGLREGRTRPAAASFSGGSFPGNVPTYWQLSHLRNPFFTGREDELEQLHRSFAPRQSSVLIQTITGLAGVGKSQTAIEYAYRYQHEYQAVFWVQADTRENLQSDLLQVAETLQLPERAEQEQALVLAAVRRWLETHDRWLLLLDNMEDQRVVREALPTRGQGHALLTARNPVLGTLSDSLAMDVLPEEECISFLLRRARLRIPGTAEAAASQREEARGLIKEVGALPLALDQAGAYIEENRISLQDYLDLYKQYRKTLLARRGRLPALDDEHVESVATTFALAFTKVASNMAAAELLRMCAFLAPAAIPEELFAKGSSALPQALQQAVSDPLSWNDTLALLRRYALLDRQPDTRTISLHRLVQTVQKDAMEEEPRPRGFRLLPATQRNSRRQTTQRRYAERVVQTVNKAFPTALYDTWEACQRLLPHSLECSRLIDQWGFISSDAARLLNRTSYYLNERGQYTEALPLAERALAIRKRALGPKHGLIGTDLTNIASIYRSQGRYNEIFPLLQQSLKIARKTHGPDHPSVATDLNNMGELFKTQGRYEEALPLYQQALAIREKALGPEHPDVATTLNNIAAIYYAQGRYTEALPLFQQALAIMEQALSPTHIDIAMGLNNLAELYRVMNQPEEARPLYQRALDLWEKALGPDHPLVAAGLGNLGLLSFAQERYDEALTLLQQALSIREKALGPDHPDVALTLSNLSEVYRRQGDYKKAFPLIERALAIDQRTLGPDHPDVSIDLSNLAALYKAEGQYEQALPLLQQALTILEQKAPDHPNMAGYLKGMAEMLNKLGRSDEAAEMEARATAILAMYGLP